MGPADLSPQPVAPDLKSLAPQRLATVRRVADELRPQARVGASLGLDHSLERDLGMDILARVELITRIDHDLGVSLAEAALPRRGEVRVTIGAALAPAGPGWDPALELRDAARKTIATTLAETTHDD